MGQALLPGQAMRWGWSRAIAAAALAAGAAIRCLALDDDLWLDEIWSLQMAGSLRTAVDVFQISVDGNHFLNTLLLYLMGDVAPVLYRLPALLTGLVAIALAFQIGERFWPGCGGAIHALVFATSYPMIVYSTEVRGYAPAIACALGIYAVCTAAQPPAPGAAPGPPPDLSPRQRVLVWSCALLGFLSHLSFAFFYAAFGVWSVYRALRTHASLRAAAGSLLVLHGVPALFLAALYAVVLKDLHSVGGPPWTYAEVIAQTLGWGLGLPAALGLLPLAALAAAILLGDAAVRRRTGDDSWVLLPLAAVVFPALVVAAREPRLLVPRYFLLGLVFFLIALGAVLTRLFARNRPLGALALCAVMAGNLVPSVLFVRHGRGDYADAIRYIAAHSATGEVVIGSDDDQRTLRLLSYYRRYLQPEQQLVYARRADLRQPGPTWLILHSFAQPPQPSLAITVKAGTSYRLKRSFPYYGPSGTHWFVYRRAELAAARR